MFTITVTRGQNLLCLLVSPIVLKYLWLFNRPFSTIFVIFIWCVHVFDVYLWSYTYLCLRYALVVQQWIVRAIFQFSLLGWYFKISLFNWIFCVDNVMPVPVTSCLTAFISMLYVHCAGCLNSLHIVLNGLLCSRTFTGVFLNGMLNDS